MNITKFIKKITMSTMSNEKALEIIIRNIDDLESLGDTDTITKLITKAAKKDFKRLKFECFHNSLLNNIISQLKRDPKVMLYAVKQDPNNLNYAKGEALTDEIIDIALSTGKYNFNHFGISINLEQNPKVMLYAVKQDPNNLNYAKGEALTEDVIKTAIDSGYKFNDSSSHYLLNNPIAMLYAVKQDPNNLNYAKGEALTEDVIKTAIDSGYKFNDSSSHYLLNNPIAMLYAVKQDPNNLNYAKGEALTEDVIKTAIDSGYKFNDSSSHYLLNNPIAMLYAVKQDPNNLNYAKGEALTEDVIKTAIDSGYKFNDSSSHYLLNNPIAMLYAVKQDPNNLNYAKGEALTEDVIKTAIDSGYKFNDSSSHYLLNNPIAMMYAVKQDPNNLNYVSDKALTDEMIDIALSTGKYVFDAKETNYTLKQNPKVMMYAVKQDPNNLNYALGEVLTDEMIDITLSTGKYIFDARNASIALKQNPKVMMYAVKQNPNNLNYAEDEALTDEIIDIALSTGNYVFDAKEAAYKLKQNPKVMMYAVKQDPNNLNYVEDEALTDEIIKAAYDNGFWDLKNNNKNNDDISIIIAKLRKMIELKHYQNKNTDKMIEHIKKRFFDLTEDKIAELYSLYKRSELTNSEEAYKLRDQIIDGALEQDDPLEVFAKIEKIFEKNNLPLFAKIYKCFETLYPNFNKSTFNFDKNSRISPDLLNANPLEKRMAYLRRNGSDRDIRMQMVFNDLLRISICSADRSLIDYMNNIKVGNDLYLDIVSGKRTFESLTFEEKNVLDIFSSHLEALQENKTQSKNMTLDNLSLPDKIRVLSKEFSPTDRHSLPDRIIRSFAYYAGFDSFESLNNYIIDSYKKAERLGESNAIKRQTFSFEDGDLLRCIGNIDALEASLDIGNVCKEFLGPLKGTSDSDMTPLDIDFSLINTANGMKKTIYSCISGTPTGFGFGNIYLVTDKNNPNIRITRDNNGNIDSPYDPMKLEVFSTEDLSGVNAARWGARTGYSLVTDVDYIIYKKNFEINSLKPYNEDGSVNYVNQTSDVYDDLIRLKMLLAKKGIYKPVYDFTGKLVFTKKEYDTIRSKLDGISYYKTITEEEKAYPIVDTSLLYFPGIEELVTEMQQDRSKQQEKRKIITDKIKEILVSSLGATQINDTILNDLSQGNIDLLETGSTSRGTNVPGDADYDFMTRVGRNDLNNTAAVIRDLNSLFSPQTNISHDNRFRGKDIKLDGIEEPIDIDISFTQKRDKVDYSTDTCLSDLLRTIEKEYPEQFPLVKANIVYAKKILKAGKAYKSRRSSEAEG